MPVYEYECDICGKRFDLHRRYGDSHPTICPDGHESIHRVFAPPTIIFRGSGFYVTDNKSNGRPSQRSPKDQESSKPEKKESKTEAKEGAKS